MFCYSLNEEVFHCQFPTVQEAIEAARAESRSGTFWIARCEPPTQPEVYWDAENWLEHVSCQDEYNNEWAENWDESSPEQRQELEQEVRIVLAAWLDRHGLRPKFWSCPDAVKFTSTPDGKVEPDPQAAERLSEWGYVS